ncbi:MAG: GTP cyclohydrolase I FolE [Alphaproteobacteria bacterium]|nr:GTP cyclohydrolase I FolE [Alphaproteobacteria bacterium]
MSKKQTAPKKPKLVSSTQRPAREEAEAAIRTLLAWVGENPEREGLRDTPRRVIKAFDEYCAGYNMNAGDILAKTFSETGGYDGAVLVKHIEFESRCEHHLAPFLGKAHISYIPSGKIVGLSKIARLVDMYARRLQTQERLTSEITNALQKHLKPKGIAVMLEAEHFCMKVRGVHKDHAVTVTTRFTGEYQKDDDLREEFFAQVRG